MDYKLNRKFLTIPILFLSILAFFKCTNSGGSDIELIKNLELTRLESLVNANMEIATPLHADDFQLITPNGTEVSKEQYLGQLESGILDYEIWNAENIKVRMYENVAVLRYNDRDFRVVINGELALSGSLKHTNLYEKRNGKWQIVWSHASGGQNPNATTE